MSQEKPAETKEKYTTLFLSANKHITTQHSLGLVKSLSKNHPEKYTRTQGNKLFIAKILRKENADTLSASKTQPKLTNKELVTRYAVAEEFFSRITHAATRYGIKGIHPKTKIVPSKEGNSITIISKLNKNAAYVLAKKSHIEPDDLEVSDLHQLITRIGVDKPVRGIIETVLYSVIFCNPDIKPKNMVYYLIQDPKTGAQFYFISPIDLSHCFFKDSFNIKTQADLEKIFKSPEEFVQAIGFLGNALTTFYKEEIPFYTEDRQLVTDLIKEELEYLRKKNPKIYTGESDAYIFAAELANLLVEVKQNILTAYNKTLEDITDSARGLDKKQSMQILEWLYDELYKSIKQLEEWSEAILQKEGTKKEQPAESKAEIVTAPAHSTPKEEILRKEPITLYTEKFCSECGGKHTNSRILP